MKKKIKKTVIFMLSSVLIVTLILSGSAAILICQYGKTDHKQKADVAIVLGAAVTADGVSPVYQERLDHARWLYENGYVQYIITTGGVSGENIQSDADLAKEYLIGEGVPADVIFTENTSTITEENLRHAKEIMETNCLTSCIVVSDPLHMKRAMLMAYDFKMTAFSSPTPTTRYQSLKTQIPFLLREVFFYLGYSVLRPFR